MRGTLFGGVPINRMRVIVFGGLYGGSPIHGNYHNHYVWDPLYFWGVGGGGGGV